MKNNLTWIEKMKYFLLCYFKYVGGHQQSTGQVATTPLMASAGVINLDQSHGTCRPE